MIKDDAQTVWQSIVSVLEDKMQFGFLEQVQYVVSVSLESDTLVLGVTTEEALDFFRADVNQQRLFIVSRPISTISNIKVELIEAEPLR
jgi:hypothetical protein